MQDSCHLTIKNKKMVVILYCDNGDKHYLLAIHILCITANFGHSFDILIFDFLLKPPQLSTGLFYSFSYSEKHEVTGEEFENDVICVQYLPILAKSLLY